MSGGAKERVQGRRRIVRGFRGAGVGEASDAITVQFGIDGNGIAA